MHRTFGSQIVILNARAYETVGSSIGRWVEGEICMYRSCSDINVCKCYAVLFTLIMLSGCVLILSFFGVTLHWAQDMICIAQIISERRGLACKFHFISSVCVLANDFSIYAHSRWLIIDFEIWLDKKWLMLQLRRLEFHFQFQNSCNKRTAVYLQSGCSPVDQSESTQTTTSQNWLKDLREAGRVWTALISWQNALNE